MSSFGEFEFWFAGIKVAAIIVFIALGSLFVLGVWPNKSLDFSNLTAHGGLFPLGVGAIFSAIVVVIFSMVGAEVATIAAAESHDPGKAIARATNSVILRIAVFFVGSIFLLAVILPWNSAELEASPYVSAFKLMGIPYADHIMNAVVLTAVLSCLNSGLYTSSRMLFVLAARREAPVALMYGQQGRVCRWPPSSLDRRRLPVRDRRGRVTGSGVLLPAELLRGRHLVRLPADRHLADHPAPADRAGEAHGQDVGLPRAVLHRRRRDPRRAGPDGVRRGRPDAAAPQPGVLGDRGHHLLRDQEAPRPRRRPRLPPRPPSRAAPAERVLVLANETVNGDELLDELRAIDRGPATRSTSSAFRPTRSTPVRRCTKERRSSGRPPPRPLRPDWTERWRSCARRTCTPTERWATTSRSGPWPMRWRSSSRTGWSSAPIPRIGPPGSATTWSSGPGRPTTSRSPT